MKINCCILTPERLLYEGEVDFVAVQAYDGERGFLYNHSPLISELGIGEIRLRSAGRTDYLVVEGGFVEIKANELTILAESAIEKKDLSREEIQYQIDEFSAKSPKEKLELEIELLKLKARLKVAAR